MSGHIRLPAFSGKDFIVHALLNSSTKNAPWSRARTCVLILKQGSKSSVIYTNVAQQMLTWPVMSLSHSLTQEWLSQQATVCSVSFCLQNAGLCSPQEPNVQNFTPFHLDQVRERHDQRCPKVRAAKVHHEDVFIFTVSSFPCLCLFPPKYYIHSAKQGVEMEKYASGLPNKLSFLWTRVRLRKSVRWEQYNQSNLRSVFMLYDLKHQTTPPQLSPQLCNSILSKARRCCFTSCTSNCRSHLLLHNSPVDNNLGGHCQFGALFCFFERCKRAAQVWLCQLAWDTAIRHSRVFLSSLFHISKWEESQR